MSEDELPTNKPVSAVVRLREESYKWLRWILALYALNAMLSLGVASFVKPYLDRLTSADVARALGLGMIAVAPLLPFVALFFMTLPRILVLEKVVDDHARSERAINEQLAKVVTGLSAGQPLNPAQRSDIAILQSLVQQRADYKKPVFRLW